MKLSLLILGLLCLFTAVSLNCTWVLLGSFGAWLVLAIFEFAEEFNKSSSGHEPTS